jgi:hypothetical protein
MFFPAFDPKKFKVVLLTEYFRRRAKPAARMPPLRGLRESRAIFRNPALVALG